MKNHILEGDPYNTDHLAPRIIKNTLEEEPKTNPKEIAGTISEQNARIKRAFFDIPR